MATALQQCTRGAYSVNNQPTLGKRGGEVRVALRAELQRAREAAVKRRRTLRTRQAVLNYIAALRPKIDDIFGPPSTCPLNPRTFGTPLSRNGYTVEKVLFDTELGLSVSANLYLPTGASAQNPAPAVLLLCGHDPLGKANDSYQRAAQGLALLGFAVLVADDIGNGEREQEQLPSDSVVSQHLVLGRQLPPIGESLARQQVRDARKAIDYLIWRSDVDTTHIGVTGNSGGGTQTAWVAAADPRVTMAAPSCFVTDYLSNFDNELAQDHEQFLTKMLTHGLDMVDLLLMIGDGWLQLVAQAKDYFDRRGWSDIALELLWLRDLLGNPKRFHAYMGPGSHGFHQDGREAMYTHFCAATFGTTVHIDEPAGIAPEAVDSGFLTTDPRYVPTLLCTATGNVHDEPGAVYLHDVNRDKVEAFEILRGTPIGDNLRTRIRTSLRLPSTGREAPPDHAVHKFYETITTAIATHVNGTQDTYFPRNGRGAIYPVEATQWGRANLYRFTPVSQVSPLEVAPAGSHAILTLPGERVELDCLFDWRQWEFRGPDASWPNAEFFALNPLLTGETLPDVNDTYVEDIHCSLFNMLDLNVLGIQVWETLRCIDLLHAHGYEQVYLAGREHGAIIAATAAVLDPRVTKCHVWNMLSRFRACVVSGPPWMAWTMKSLPHDVLLPETGFELDDLRTQLTLDLGGEFAEYAKFGAWKGQGGEF